jgi:inner membrane protease ATP23
MSSPQTQAPPSATPAPDAADAAKPSPLPAIVQNDPKRTGFDPQTKWWVNYFKILTGSIGAEGAFHYREWRTTVNEAADCRRCEDMRDWAFAHSPTVVFLRQKIEALNGTLDASNVRCQRCPARLTEDGEVHRQSGGFDPDRGVLLCANEIRDKKHLEDTLSHEMVHAWDHLRYKVDWAGEKSLKHAACTEVSSWPSHVLAVALKPCVWRTSIWEPYAGALGRHH